MKQKSQQEIIEMYRQMRRRNVVRLLARYGKYLVLRVEQIAMEEGFSDFKSHYMAFIGNIGYEGSTAKDLARCIWVSKQAMSKTLKELESKGYILLAPHEYDGRAQVIYLTEKGTNMLDMGSRITEKIKEEIKSIVGDEDLEHLVNTLEKLMNHVDGNV